MCVVYVVMVCSGALGLCCIIFTHMVLMLSVQDAGCGGTKFYPT